MRAAWNRRSGWTARACFVPIGEEGAAAFPGHGSSAQRRLGQSPPTVGTRPRRYDIQLSPSVLVPHLYVGFTVDDILELLTLPLAIETYRGSIVVEV